MSQKNGPAMRKTVTMADQFVHLSGKCIAVRTTPVSAKLKAKPVARKISARRWFGRRQIGRSSVGPWGAWVGGPAGAGAVTAISAGHLLQILDERVQLVGGKGLLEVLGHDPTPEAWSDLLVGVGYRGADERLVLALERLVEVRAHRTGGRRVGQRVAAGAAVVGEDLLARGGDLARARARGRHGGVLLLQPGGEGGGGEDVHDRAHRRVAEAAQLGADDREVADLRRGDAVVGGDA